MEADPHQLNKTHCPRGHAYTQDNTMLLTDGGKRSAYRKCRTCHRERQRAYRAAVANRNEANEEKLCASFT